MTVQSALRDPREQGAPLKLRYACSFWAIGVRLLEKSRASLAKLGAPGRGASTPSHHPRRRFINQPRMGFNLFPGSAMPSTLMQLWSPAFASRPAVFIPDGPEVTYEELQSQMGWVTAGRGARGAGAGEPIGIVLPNNLEFLVAFLATTWA